MADRTRMTVPKFFAAKAQRRKLAVVTAYDWLWAGICDAAGVDAILVGDSLAMVVQGHATTLPVTFEEMLYHGTIVGRAVKSALVIVDLPFLSYHESPQQAIRNAGTILKQTTAAAVKLEGGVTQAKTIQALVDADIPVMAHVGLRPQAVHALGGMGKIQRNAQQLLEDAHAAADAGAFAIVLEMVSQSITAKITAELSIPTIGIGSGPGCDGQVLVGPDLLGLTEGFQPKFLKRFANLRSEAMSAIQNYADEVRNGLYPTTEHAHD